jgi:hypothetical protein
MDEAQFQGSSTTSNALAANTLRQHSKIGIPNLFASNFSLCHRLWGRPQQERQRILGVPKTLLPDPFDGVDWFETVAAFQAIAPNLYVFDLEKCCEQLHFWTAGIKRLLGELLLIAARFAAAARKPVTLETIERAYKSPDYTANREDIGLLYQQAKTGVPASKSRKDLWSPFSPLEGESEQLADAAKAADEGAVAQAYMRSALTPEEKRRYEEILKARAKKGGAKATVTPIRSGLSKAEALRAADEQFRNDE